MKKIFITLYCSIFITLVFCSCVGGPADPYYVPLSRQQENVYYTARAQNAPLLSKKEDLSFSLLYANGDNHKGIDIHGAYNPGNHVTLISSFSAYSNSTGTDKINEFEFGAGYYLPLPPNFHFETYAGVGFQKIQNDHYTGFTHLTNHNYFIQPAISVESNSKSVQFAFVSRFNIVNFKMDDSTYSNDREPYVTSQMQLLKNNPTQIFWEPGFIFRVGWENFLFHFGYSFTSDITASNLNIAKSHFSAGVMVRLNTKHM